MGRFVKQRRAPRRGGSGNTMESAFEDSKTYVLTELGSQFVHYTMTELVADRCRRRRSEKVKVGTKCLREHGFPTAITLSFVN